MGRTTYQRWALSAALAVLVCAPWPAPVEAQSRTRVRELDGTQFGIGYIANAPDIVTGGGAYFVIPKWGGIGLYIDAKFDLQSPSGSQEFEPGLTATMVEDQVAGAKFIEHESSYNSFNLAVVRPLSPYLMIYGGGGIALRTQYNEYEEPSKFYGRGGIFWVEAPAREETRFNMMLGIMMRMSSRLTSHFGFETQPRGITGGLSFRFPRW